MIVKQGYIQNNDRSHQNIYKKQVNPKSQKTNQDRTKDVPIKPLKPLKRKKKKLERWFTPPPAGNLNVSKTLDKGEKEGISLGSTVMVYKTFYFPPTPRNQRQKKKTGQAQRHRSTWIHNRDRQPNRQTGGETDTAGPTPTPRPTGRGSRSDGYPHVVRSFSYPAQHAPALDGAPRKEGFPAWTGYPGSTGPQTRPGTAAAWH